ncbi:DUF4413 and hAT family C-terminal dimerization domain-containing protein, partial [Candidatus Phytoplasma fabacearum]|uniref:DUF4413 and hAT family C-terminal dimerization domain-containing protein n=1 Tax=Candidatus Phytoplasma fabacearum TaxID=2982628 RepID=UPI0030E8B2F5
GVPNNEDWDNARCFVRFLKIFYDITQIVSGTNFVTSSQYFNEDCKILQVFHKWIGNSDPLFGNMAKKMKAKYDKYWGNVKNMNILIFVAVVLDPRSKFKFVEWSLHKFYEKEVAEFLCNKIKESLYDMFGVYMDSNINQQSVETSPQLPSEMGMDDFDSPDLSFDIEFERDMNLGSSSHKNEVDLYLTETLEKKIDTFDILMWWKVNSGKFPILSQIARDVLAMPVSTVASESAFSTRGRVLNSYKSSLTPKTVEALVCTQNWCRSSPWSMDIEELVADIERIEMGNML